MTPQITTFLLIIAAAIGGYVLGLIESRATSLLRKKTPSRTISLANRAGTTSPPLPPPPPLSESERLGEKTVLKLSLDKALKYHLELDGTRLENPEQISPEQRQRAINVVIQMRPWLDGKPVPAAQSAPAPRTESGTTSPVLQAPQPVAHLPVSQNTPAPKAGTKEDPLKINPRRGFSSLMSKDVKAEIEKKTVSIVMMIDEVLQAKLPGSPFQNQGIRLEDGLAGEVMVHVGSQVYNGIDAVPDQGIRDVIRAAITEWEKK